MKSKLAAIAILAAAIHPAFARIGEDEKQLETRYGKTRLKTEGEDGTAVLAFRRGDLVIQATLWKGKAHQMSYYTMTGEEGGKDVDKPLPPLGEAKVKELLAENAPEAWEEKGKVYLAHKAKLEAEVKGGILTIRTQAFKAQQAAAGEKPMDEKKKDKEAPALDSYVGLTVAEAGKRAEKAGLKWRIVMEDGESKPVTMDFSETRVNFTVVKGKVTAVKNG